MLGENGERRHGRTQRAMSVAVSNPQYPASVPSLSKGDTAPVSMPRCPGAPAIRGGTQLQVSNDMHPGPHSRDVTCTSTGPIWYQALSKVPDAFGGFVLSTRPTEPQHLSFSRSNGVACFEALATRLGICFGARGSPWRLLSKLRC